jgi:hypothetical protein
MRDMGDLGWHPPSPEGLSHPDELLAVFNKCEIAAEIGFKGRNEELHREALVAMRNTFLTVLAQLHDERGDRPGT